MAQGLTARRPRARGGRIVPTIVLVVCGLFFLLPILAVVRFSFQNLRTFQLRWSNIFDRWSLDGLRTAFKEKEFLPTLYLSLRLALGTVLVTIALLLPTALLVHIKLPRARSFVEFCTLLPYMIPPIALVAGVAAFFRPNAKWFLNSDYSLIPFYVVLALPFTYRSIDAGIRAIDVRTLIDASRSLGAGWLTTMFRVLIPNLRMAIIGASFLTATVVLGEFTIAQTLLKRTFPQFLAEFYTNEGQAGSALSVLTLLGTVALLGILTVLTRKRGQKAASLY